MRRTFLGPVILLAAASMTGCAQTVQGTAGPVGPAGSLGLVSDVVESECLLNASEFRALVGQTVRPPMQNTVPRADGSTGSSCVATADGQPVAMINVYRARTGAADYVTGAHRLVPPVGDATAVATTEAGPTLQLASGPYLVTILVTGKPPTDATWRTAAATALTRLPAN